MQPKVTNFTTILMLLLKECRLERNLHQAMISEKMGKSPSAINKIESSTVSLQMNDFLAYCGVLNISPSIIMNVAEKYLSLFSMNGWQIVGYSIPSSEDTLLQEAKEYYDSIGYKKRITYGWLALNGPVYYENGLISGLDVFLFALYPERKKALLQE